jgi:hypothetical protein
VLYARGKSIGLGLSLSPTKRIGTTGFEPATPPTPRECATGLRYAPTCSGIMSFLRFFIVVRGARVSKLPCKPQRVPVTADQRLRRRPGEIEPVSTARVVMIRQHNEGFQVVQECWSKRSINHCFGKNSSGMDSHSAWELKKVQWAQKWAGSASYCTPLQLQAVPKNVYGDGNKNHGPSAALRGLISLLEMRECATGLCTPRQIRFVFPAVLVIPLALTRWYAQKRECASSRHLADHPPTIRINMPTRQRPP